MAKKQDKAEDSPQPDSNWKFEESDKAPVQSGPTNVVEASEPVEHHRAVTWTASEYMTHDKTTSWFIGLGAGGLVVGGIIFLMTRDYLATFLIMTMVVIFGVFAARKPQELEYVIDDHGLQIGPKHYPYTRFKSFAIMNEDGILSIMLLPLTRFMPSLSIYYDLKDEKNIVNVLSGYLPMEQRDHDLTDQLMRKIRF